MEPHIYHLNRFARFFYCAMGLALMGMGAWAVFQMGSWALVLALPFGALGIYWCRRAICSCLTLTDTEISVRYASDEDSAKLSDIEGWRMDGGGNTGPYWVLQIRDSSDTLRIEQNFAVDDFFLDFISKLRNLNELEMSVVP